MPDEKSFGRPAWEPTEEQMKEFELLASSQCTVEEICAFFGIGKTTLYKNRDLDADFAEAIKRAQTKGKAYVKSKLMSAISKGNVAAAIFYLKTQCGWKEKIELSGSIDLVPIISPTLVQGKEWDNLTKGLVEDPTLLSLGDPKQDPKQHS